MHVAQLHHDLGCLEEAFALYKPQTGGRCTQQLLEQHLFALCPLSVAVLAALYVGTVLSLRLWLALCCIGCACLDIARLLMTGPADNVRSSPECLLSGNLERSESKSRPNQSLVPLVT